MRVLFEQDSTSARWWADLLALSPVLAGRANRPISINSPAVADEALGEGIAKQAGGKAIFSVGR